MPINFDFAKHAVVESADALPEEVRGYYEAGADGKLTYAASVKPLIESYTSTLAALGAERGKTRDLNKENTQRRLATKAIEDLATELGLDTADKDVVEVIKGHLSDLTSKVKGGEEVRLNLDKVKAEFEKRQRDAIALKDGEIGKMKGSLEKYLVDKEATSALATVKGSVDLLLPHVRSSVRVVQDGDDFVVRVVDSANDIRHNGAGQPMTIEDLVKEMKASDKFARAFESTAPGGSGTPPKGQSRSQASRPQQGEMSATDKIAAGLAKGQYKRNAA